jgi:3'(2'), 5'-bisphosphate nucleotidase
MAYEKEQTLALKAAAAAAQLCEQVRAQKLSDAIEKPDESPVTIADYASQAIICRLLAEAFPEDAIVGEEDASLLQQPEMAACLARVTAIVGEYVSGATPEEIVGWVGRGKGESGRRFWTLDPIDGTKGYVRGDQYAIALALIEDGEVKVGVVGAPAMLLDPARPEAGRGALFLGVRGQGAKLYSMDLQLVQDLKVNDASKQADFRLVQSVEKSHGTPTEQEAAARAAGLTAEPFCMDSLGKYGAIARGEADLYLRLPSGKYLNRKENIWDHAAGVVVLEEAGGRVSDRHGKPLDFTQGGTLANNTGIVASNGVLHEAVLEALRG